ALIYVHCPQYQRTMWCKTGNKPMALSAIAVTIATVRAPFSSYSTKTKGICFAVSLEFMINRDSMNMRLLQQLDRAAEVFRDQCEKRKLWLLLVFSIMYWGGTYVLASRKLMWNDELFTFYIAQLPSVAEIWSVLSTGAEQIPPVFYMITRASFWL